MAHSTHRELKMRDGRTLAYAEYGIPTGRPIVYCHGVPSSRVEGDLILDAATVATLGLRVIAPDRPGVGRSDFQPGRRIVDWPNDVLDLTQALGIERFAVLGSSGGAPYAAVCGVVLADRVQAVGLMGGVAPPEAPGVWRALSPPLRLMFRLARSAPVLLSALYRLNLRAVRGGGDRARERMARLAPQPDRVLLQRPDVGRGFMACFEEACRNGPRGAVTDMRLIAMPWGFDLAALRVPVMLWHGELDRNVPVVSGRYLAGAIPACRAVFYPDEAHLSVPLNHQREIFGVLTSVMA